MKKLGIKPLIHKEGQIINCRLGEYTEIGPYHYLENVTFDDYSYTGPHCIFQNAEIGKFSNIAAQVRIGPTDHPMDRPTQHHFTYRRKIYGLDEINDESFFQWREKQVCRIGHDTWLGHGAIVMSGVSIGTGAVIGAGAVVTRDVPDYGIAVGVPAKILRFRFEPQQQEALKQIAWWDWDHAQLKERIEDFSGSVDAFIEKYGS